MDLYHINDHSVYKIPRPKAERFNKEQFKRNFKINISKLTRGEMEFDMIGIDVSVANAFRRILLSEVPTMAIEKCLIYNNTSIIQDEVLAHRLGLIPLAVDPREFDYRADVASLEPAETDTIVFELKIQCKHNPHAPKDSTERDELFVNHKVYSKDLVWIPIGNQAEKFAANPIRPTYDDILLAKLLPGQEIDIRMLCYKGVGKDHAKFSPVATATYRLMPSIELLRPIEGELADELKACFASGVIEIDHHAATGRRVARVADPRADTCTREVLRHERLKDAVQLGLVENHFIFCIESTGALPPDVLMCEAIKVLAAKCDNVLRCVERSQSAKPPGRRR